MVTTKQKRELRSLMSHIKAAKDDPQQGEAEIKERTRELHRYLEREGIVLRDDI